MSMLFNEPPLVISPTLASRIGLNEAIIVQQVFYWQEKMDREVYNTYKEWKKQFPWWSTDTIQRAMLKLQKLGIIEVRIDQEDGNKKYYRVVANHSDLCVTSPQNAVTSPQDAVIIQATENTQRITNSNALAGENQKAWDDYVAMVAFWDKKRGQKWKPNKDDFRNFLHWYETYDLLDMKGAIMHLPFDSYWGTESISPTIMLRRKDRQQNPCDRIGTWLNLQQPGNTTLAGVKQEYIKLRKWFDAGRPATEEDIKEVLIPLRAYDYEDLLQEAVDKFKEARNATN